MAKKVVGMIKLQVPAGKANPSPPIGPALGQRGLNIMEFCKAFNAQTQNLEPGMPIPVVITAYGDRSFTFVTKTPPASYFLKKAYEGLDPAAPPVKLEEAVKQIKSRAAAKFDETVEIAMNLNLDPRKPDQNLRGTVMLPHGTGKSVRVAVFARGDRAKEAEAAGADIVGAEDLAEKVQAGQIDFDRAIATPDMM